MNTLFDVDTKEYDCQPLAYSTRPAARRQTATQWRHISPDGHIYRGAWTQMTADAQSVRTARSGSLPSLATSDDFDPDTCICDLATRLESGDTVFYLRAKASDLWTLVVL